MHLVRIPKWAFNFCHPDIPFFDKTGAAIIFPAIPVLLGFEYMLFTEQEFQFVAVMEGKQLKALMRRTKLQSPTYRDHGGKLVTVGWDFL